MNAMQKAISQLQKKCTPIKDENDFEYYATNNIVFAMEIAIKEAKKQVFDDIWNTWAKKYGDNHTSNQAIFDMHNMIRELEKHHLSTDK